MLQLEVDELETTAALVAGSGGKDEIESVC
jgi:hypothetical protein